MRGYILTLSCPDRPGIVHAVAGFLTERRYNIVDSQQFGDAQTGRFFMRVQFTPCADDDGVESLRVHFSAVANGFAMEWELHDSADRSRLLLLVSRHGHCLNDLLYRWRAGMLSADIAGVVSNHRDFESLTTSYGLPFLYLPVDRSTKPEAEGRLLEIIHEEQIDLVVLARYMQVLSPHVCDQLAGRAINIHHSFLPSFSGARPYTQAHARGVKLIGATAHYVTAELDQGPIIEQDVARVSHSLSPEQIAAVGRDVECVTLARAVQWHLERRVLIDGPKTVVFR